MTWVGLAEGKNSKLTAYVLLFGGGAIRVGIELQSGFKPRSFKIENWVFVVLGFF